MTDKLEWFRENEARIYHYFDTLHAIPEPGFQEVKTSAFLAGELRRLGYAVQDSFARTAVLGTLETGQSGPVVCLRADMDALTFTVDGETKHIHACGHDANCTEVLAAAAAAAETGFLKHGTLKVLFQPCEETMQGALKQAKVKGRIEMVPVSDKFTLMIDYAHNAMSLKSLLETLRAYEPGRLVCLFGCGGNRSRLRRYEMGEVSGSHGRTNGCGYRPFSSWYFKVTPAVIGNPRTHGMPPDCHSKRPAGRRYRACRKRPRGLSGNQGRKISDG